MIVTAQSAPEVSQSGHVETGWAKRLTYCAPQWVSWLGLGGQTDYCPIRPIVAVQNPAGQIILMPSRHDENKCTVRPLPRVQIIRVPIPYAIAVCLALSFLTRLHRIVDDNQVAADAGYTTSHTRRAHPAILLCFPIIRCRALRAKLHSI